MRRAYRTDDCKDMSIVAVEQGLLTMSASSNPPPNCVDSALGELRGHTGYVITYSIPTYCCNDRRAQRRKSDFKVFQPSHAICLRG